MRYTKVAKLLLFVSVILLVLTAVFTIQSIKIEPPQKRLVTGYKYYESQDLGRHETAETYQIVAFFLGFFTIFGFMMALADNYERARDFKEVFGFDPRKNRLRLVDGDPQEYVSAEIERRRLDARALFSEETKLRKGGGVFGPEKLRKKVEAKEKFWAACKSAHDWGFKTPSSINESVSNLHESMLRSVRAKSGTDESGVEKTS